MIHGRERERLKRQNKLSTKKFLIRDIRAHACIQDRIMSDYITGTTCGIESLGSYQGDDIVCLLHVCSSLNTLN